MIFSIMTSYARARAESLIEKCKVGFMERPERIVLFMIGAFTDRMAAVLWVILVLSIVTVANRIHYTYLVLNAKPMPTRLEPDRRGVLARVLLARRAGDAAYDLWVIAILAFVWLTPPDWLRDPTGAGPVGSGMRCSRPHGKTASDCSTCSPASGRCWPSSSIGWHGVTRRPFPSSLPRPRGDAPRRHRAAHAAVYLQEAASGDLHELVFIPGDRRLEIDTVSTWASTRPASHLQLVRRSMRRFPQVRVKGPSWWRGDRRVAPACASTGRAPRRTALSRLVKASIDRLQALAR